jgi:hypothetical protein
LNGVQAIDDEFLEWFVGKAKDSGKPIDIVEVGKTNKLIDNYAEKDEDKWEVKYHIYIPKEEPKQKPLEEARANSYIDFAKSNQEVEMYSFVVGFNRGAKWQEQQTIEQEFGKKITDVNYEKSFDEIIEQAKEIEEKQQENIYERERFKAIDFAKWFSDFNGLTWEEKRVTKECLDTLYEKYLGTLGGGI